MGSCQGWFIPNDADIVISHSFARGEGIISGFPLGFMDGSVSRIVVFTFIWIGKLSFINCYFVYIVDFLSSLMMGITSIAKNILYLLFGKKSTDNDLEKI